MRSKKQDFQQNREFRQKGVFLSLRTITAQLINSTFITEEEKEILQAIYNIINYLCHKYSKNTNKLKKELL